jgi:lipooligosaccharide transport system permease protein
MGFLNRYSLAVFRRQLLVWRRIIRPALTSNVADPLIFLFAFGFGLGAIVDQIGGLSYLAFVVPGMMAYSVMFAVTFETTVNTFARVQMQRTWDAILATPVSLTELIAGEALWAVAKGLFSASCVLVVGWLWGGIPSLGGALLAMPVLALGGLCFASCGLAATAHAKSWEFFSYTFTFWVTPMFMFSGTFFEVDRFPWFIQAFARLLPMYHVIELVRPLTAGLTPEPGKSALHLAYLVGLTAVAFALARYRFARRMFS